MSMVINLIVILYLVWVLFLYVSSLTHAVLFLFLDSWLVSKASSHSCTDSSIESALLCFVILSCLASLSVSCPRNAAWFCSILLSCWLTGCVTVILSCTHNDWYHYDSVSSDGWLLQHSFPTDSVSIKDLDSAVLWFFSKQPLEYHLV
jgi:hypothetical protein